ncbi:MAG TPA: CdvA-like protein [Nitrosopumilaceae archaeon]|nr:CdvA-like protein [Nitrosopumilaceae archaeon]
MTNDGKALIGKQVKDMYGTFLGKALGTITHIDGTIESVGVDCGAQGLQHIPFEQIVVQGDVLIYVPKWRLESQRLLKEKELTLRRLKAMINIASDYDDVKEDTSLIHEKYKSNLSALEETEKQLKAKLEARLEELNDQMKSVKMFEFDAKVQFNSNEITEQTYESVRKLTTEYIEHITHETSEISNIQRKIADLNLEVQQATEPPKKHLEESALSYLDSESGEATTVIAKLPEAPTTDPIPEPPPEPPTETIPEPPTETTPEITAEKEQESEPEHSMDAESFPPIPQQVSSTMPEPPEETTESDDKKPDSDWLSRMQAQ